MMWLARLKPPVAVAAALILATAGVAVQGRQQPAPEGAREQAKTAPPPTAGAGAAAVPDTAANRALATEQLALIRRNLDHDGSIVSGNRVNSFHRPAFLPVGTPAAGYASQDGSREGRDRRGVGELRQQAESRRRRAPRMSIRPHEPPKSTFMTCAIPAHGGRDLVERGEGPLTRRTRRASTASIRGGERGGIRRQWIHRYARPPLTGRNRDPFDVRCPNSQPDTGGSRLGRQPDGV